MDEGPKRKRRPSFGEIVSKEEGVVSFRHPETRTVLTAPCQQWIWLPSRRLKGQLPKDFFLPLRCVTDPEGLRRIYPYYSWEGFIAVAWAGGLAILGRTRKLGRHQRYSYRAMRLLFLLARRMGEFFRNTFAHSRDLYVVPAGRTDRAESNILPETVGLDAFGQGHRWTLGELTRRGEEAARRAGYAKPRSAQRIRYGLLEAARLDPLTIPEEKVPLLVQSALFNLGPTANHLDPKLIDIVTQRTLEALKKHLDDDAATFAKWFLESKSSFVHQIAKKKRSRGGPLEEDEVREALLQLGWNAYQYVGDCIGLQMQAIAQALPPDFTDQERVLFQHMHLPQPYLGGLPLVLLVERFGLIQDLLWEIWAGLPNPQLVAILHRLLDYYAVMAAKRREVDRRRKGPKIQTLARLRLKPTDA